MNKLYKNEKLFDEANAKMAKTTASLTPEGFPKDFVLSLYCECANKVCQERISIPFNEYKRVKKAANVFLVKPEHYLPEFERLVDQTNAFWTIKKRLEKLNKDFEV